MSKIIGVWLCALLMLSSAIVGMNPESDVNEKGTADAPRASYTITNVWELQNMSLDLAGDYTLANDIDASITPGWNSGAGFVPVGTSATRFTGSLDGRNCTITGLYINRTSTNYIGLFGYTDTGSTVSNTTLLDCNVSGLSRVSGLVGANNGEVSTCYVTGNISGIGYFVGELVGYNYDTVSNCHAMGNVVGGGYTGELVGINDGAVSNCSATGKVSSICEFVGGLLGANGGTGTVSNCYAGCTVSGGDQVGGLVGLGYGVLLNCYATGQTSGSTDVGGFAGFIGNIGGGVSNCYATGNVGGSSDVGGFVGYNEFTVSNCYTTGHVTGSSSVGGFAGWNNGGSVTDCFWDTQTSGWATSDGGTGKTTVEMKDLDTFTAATWDLLHIWDIDNEQSYPYFRTTSPYVIYDVFDLQIMRLDLAGQYTLANDIDASITSGWNAGAGFDPVGDSGFPFTGKFNGQNYIIYGLYINRSLEDWVGLFAYISYGSVSNVGLVELNIIGSDYVGGLAGYNHGLMSNSFASGNVTASAYWAGGLVGYNTGTVNNSYAAGTVKAIDDAGGLGGRNWGGVVSNSYATARVVGVNGYYAASVIGGLVGENSGTLIQSFATGTVTGIQCIGGLVGRTMGGSVVDSFATGAVAGTGAYIGGLVGWHFNCLVINSYSTGHVGGFMNIGGLVGNNAGGTVTSSFWDTQTSGLTWSDGGEGKTTAQMKTQSTFTSAGWNFSNIWWMLEGVTYPLLQWHIELGTQEHPYLIKNVWELQQMKNELSAHYALANDIDASPTATWNSGAGFVPVGNSTTLFSGSLNGNNHTITGLYINRPSTYVIGLFGQQTGDVSNLNLVSANIIGDGMVGGLVGYNRGSVSRCYFSGTVSGNIQVGGLIGYCYLSGPVSESHSAGTVTGTNRVAGLIGYNVDAPVSNSYSTANVIGGYDSGGLIGLNIGTVTNSYSMGAVSGTTYVGGLIGENDGTVTNCFWDIQTSGRATSAGGTGKTTAQMKDLDTFTAATWDFLNIWDIDNEQSYPYFRTTSPYTIYDVFDLQIMGLDLAGNYILANDIDASVTSSWNGGSGFDPVADSSYYFTGKFDGQNHTISGLYINRQFEDCVGMLAGTHNGAQISYVRVEDVNITGNTFVGGFMGRSYASTVSNCYVTGIVRGRGACVGGFVGETSASVSSCYADCDVYGIPSGNNYYLGGFTGAIFGPVSNCYATGNVSGPGASYVGGFVGGHFSNTIQCCYSTGDVPDSGSAVGGFEGGYGGGTITDCFWDTVTSGTTTGIGSGSSPEVQGRNTTEMMQQATFTTGGSNWDFTNVWGIDEGSSYPYLFAFHARTFKIHVYSGWNFISTPLTPLNFSLPSALTDTDGDTQWDRIMYYDSADPADHWTQFNSVWPSQLNDLKTGNEKIGVWINITTVGDGYIKVQGNISTSAVVQLRAGWNMVGYPARNDSAYTVGQLKAATGATIVEGFNSSAEYRTQVLLDSTVMKKGAGYWVLVPTDTIWVVDW